MGAGAAAGAAADAALAEAAKANGASTSAIRRALRALKRKVTEAREMDLMKQGRCEGLRRVREIAHRRVEHALAALTEAAAAECDDGDEIMEGGGESAGGETDSSAEEQIGLGGAAGGEAEEENEVVDEID